MQAQWEYSPVFSESYAVKFWYIKEDGFKAQKTEVVYCKNKHSHFSARKAIQRKHNVKDTDIISVVYQ